MELYAPQYSPGGEFLAIHGGHGGGIDSAMVVAAHEPATPVLATPALQQALVWLP
jgi:hypothetical protein